MKLNKQQMIFAGVAILIGVVLVLLPSGKAKPKSQPQPKEDLSLDVTRKQLIELMNTKEEQKRIMKYNQYLDHNPFAPLTSDVAIKTEAGLTLVGIFSGSNKPSAIINNRVLGIGETIGDKTLRSVKNDYVVLTDHSGQQTMLSMKAAFPTHNEGGGEIINSPIQLKKNDEPVEEEAPLPKKKLRMPPRIKKPQTVEENPKQ